MTAGESAAPAHSWTASPNTATAAGRTVPVPCRTQRSSSRAHLPDTRSPRSRHELGPGHLEEQLLAMPVGGVVEGVDGVPAEDRERDRSGRGRPAPDPLGVVEEVDSLLARAPRGGDGRGGGAAQPDRRSLLAAIPRSGSRSAPGSQSGRGAPWQLPSWKLPVPAPLRGKRSVELALDGRHEGLVLRLDARVEPGEDLALGRRAGTSRSSTRCRPCDRSRPACRPGRCRSRAGRGRSRRPSPSGET